MLQSIVESAHAESQVLQIYFDFSACFSFPTWGVDSWTPAAMDFALLTRTQSFTPLIIKSWIAPPPRYFLPFHKRKPYAHPYRRLMASQALRGISESMGENPGGGGDDVSPTIWKVGDIISNVPTMILGSRKRTFFFFFFFFLLVSSA